MPSQKRLLIVAFVVSVVGLHASDDLTLARKAMLFEIDLVERFMPHIVGQVAPRRFLPSEDRAYVTHNMSDSAYMTGIFCATQTWHFRATRLASAAHLANQACSTLNRLAVVSGRPGLLARAILPIDVPWFDDGVWRESPDMNFRWRGNVSSDQVAGLMFGAFVYFTHFENAETEARISETVVPIVDSILENGRRIIGYDGRPTRWGHYELSYVTDTEPMNALLLLQMVKVAGTVTGNAFYERVYRDLVAEGYARIGEGARLDVPPLEANHSDDVLIALALHTLLESEHDSEIRAHYLEAARRWFRGGQYPGVDVEANPLASFLWQHWSGESDEVPAGIATLRALPLDMKWNRDTVSSYQERFGFSFSPEPVLPQPEILEPLQISQRGRTWSFLVHNPYHVGGDRAAAAPFETNALDFLVSYWFGRAHGMVVENN